MADIYIVTVAVAGPYPEVEHFYHSSEAEAHASFAECMESVSDDYTMIELTRLETDTLDATLIRGWEGTHEDIRVEREEDE